SEDNKILLSKWKPLADTITVPPESHLFAFDTKTYREQTETAFKDQKELLARLQLRDNQAVVQVAAWMEQVRTGNGKREPVGAWVVAEMPVNRGGFIGRKQYIKLPLWSSEAREYLLREVAEPIVTAPKDKKEHPQPKGWLVDFSSDAVLVDFEGGRSRFKAKVGFDEKGNLVSRERDIVEDSATEMLVLQDGKLTVRSSRVDEADELRQDIAKKWAKWLEDVEKRKSAPTGGMGLPGEFDPKRP
ncbi:MAG: hypothetical protein K2V38_12115, partial [Gemmataceae bacterium]|nr:hypothetical protein [Gemmataceae bacterium]